ncbi:MAG: polyprenyl synthetase family protein [Bacteroidota bacterium]
MHALEFYQREFISYLKKQKPLKEPHNLYEPVHYILNLGGKRLRPVLTLIAAELFGTDHKKALPAAMAVEVFHNFSLVHDDIMDDAPLRRGKPTVHEKWNVNTGILSGDVMLINSYEYLEGYTPDVLKELFLVFNTTSVQVCEGQQYDVDFETRTDVTIKEYLKMIEYKTSVLIGAALKMGAVVAAASEKNKDLIYEFGRNLGIAFQLQDDYLDAFGNPETFGKQVGGDIIENKKTFLYLKALELGAVGDQERLVELFSGNSHAANEKVTEVKNIFKKTGSDKATKKAIEKFTQEAFNSLSKIEAPEDGKILLRQVGKNLMERSS